MGLFLPVSGSLAAGVRPAATPCVVRARDVTQGTVAPRSYRGPATTRRRRWPPIPAVPALSIASHGFAWWLEIGLFVRSFFHFRRSFSRPTTRGFIRASSEIPEKNPHPVKDLSTTVRKPLPAKRPRGAKPRGKPDRLLNLECHHRPHHDQTHDAQGNVSQSERPPDPQSHFHARGRGAEILQHGLTVLRHAHILSADDAASTMFDLIPSPAARNCRRTSRGAAR